MLVPEFWPIAFGKLVVEFALWAMTMLVSATKFDTATASICLPATMSLVMPVRVVISVGIGLAGSFNEPKLSMTWATRPSGQYSELDHAQLDDLVRLRVETCSFHVKEDANLDRLVGGDRRNNVPRHQSAQNPIVA